MAELDRTTPRRSAQKDGHRTLWSKASLYAEWGETADLERVLPKIPEQNRDWLRRVEAEGKLSRGDTGGCLRSISCISKPEAAGYVLLEMLPQIPAGKRKEALAQLEAIARRARSAFDRSCFLLAVAPPAQRPAAVKNVEAALHEDADPARCAETLLAILNRIPPRYQDRVVMAAEQAADRANARDQYGRAGLMILRRVASLRPTESRINALEERAGRCGSSVLDEDWWESVAPLLPKTVLEKAVTRKMQIGDRSEAVALMAVIAPELARLGSTGEALVLADLIQESVRYYFATAAAGILPYVSEEQRRELADRAILAAREQGSALTGAAGGENRDGTLGIWKVKALAQLLPNLPAKLQLSVAREGLEEAKAVVNVWARSEALYEIALSLHACGYYDQAQDEESGRR